MANFTFDYDTNGLLFVLENDKAVRFSTLNSRIHYNEPYLFIDESSFNHKNCTNHNFTSAEDFYNYVVSVIPPIETGVAVTVNTVLPSWMGPFTYYRITANGTYFVKSGAGHLNLAVINSPGSGSNVITFYDNTAASGTIIAQITAVNSTSCVFQFQVNFSTGLTVLVATGSASKFTISYN